MFASILVLAASAMMAVNVDAASIPGRTDQQAVEQNLQNFPVPTVSIGRQYPLYKFNVDLVFVLVSRWTAT